jgi:hypothetical protein
VTKKINPEFLDYWKLGSLDSLDAADKITGGVAEFFDDTRTLALHPLA